VQFVLSPCLITMENDNCDQSEPKSPSESENTSDQEFLASEGSVESETTSVLNDPEEAGNLQTCVVERQGSNVPIFNTSAKSGSSERMSRPQQMAEGSLNVVLPQHEGLRPPTKRFGGQPSLASWPFSTQGTRTTQGTMSEEELRGQGALPPRSSQGPEVRPVYVTGTFSRPRGRQEEPVVQRMDQDSSDQLDLTQDPQRRKTRLQSWERGERYQVRQKRAPTKEGSRELKDRMGRQGYTNDQVEQTMRVEGQADLSSYDVPGTRPWDVERTTDEPQRSMGRRGEEKEGQPSHPNSSLNPVYSARQQGGEELVWESASQYDYRIEEAERGAQRYETVDDVKEEFRGRLIWARSNELKRQRDAEERDRQASEVAQVIYESQGEDEEERLEQLKAALYQKMVDLGDDLEQLRALKRAQDKARNHSEAHDKENFDAMELYRSRGPVDLILKDEMWSDKFRLDKEAFASAQGDHWNLDWNRYQASRVNPQMNLNELVLLLKEASRLIEDLGVQMEELMGQSRFEEMREKHNLFLILMDASARRGSISPQAARLFPKSQHEKIMSWYSRFVEGMKTWYDADQKAIHAGAKMCCFALRYPVSDTDGHSSDEKPSSGRSRLVAQKDMDNRPYGNDNHPDSSGQGSPTRDFRDSNSYHGNQRGGHSSQHDQLSMDHHQVDNREGNRIPHRNHVSMDYYPSNSHLGGKASQRNQVSMDHYHSDNQLGGRTSHYDAEGMDFQGNQQQARRSGRTTTAETMEALEEVRRMNAYSRNRSTMDRAEGAQAFTRSPTQRNLDEAMADDLRNKARVGEPSRGYVGTHEEPRILRGTEVRSGTSRGYYHAGPSDRVEVFPDTFEVHRRFPDEVEIPRGSTDSRSNSGSGISVVSSANSKMIGLAPMKRPAMMGVTEELEETVIVDGFESLTPQQLGHSIKEMVAFKLTEQGCYSEYACKMICNHWPQFNLHGRTGKAEDSSKFKVIVKNVKPTSEGNFIAMYDWLESLKSEADIQSYSIRQRISWLKNTGGLASGVNETIRIAVIEKMKNITTWMKEYSPSTPSINNNYWFQVWADVMVMLIKHHFTVQHVDQAEDAYNRGLKDDKYKLKPSEDDPMNREWYKFQNSWNDSWFMLKKRDNGLLGSPIMVWNLFRAHWITQGRRGVGNMMVSLVEKAVNLLDKNPSLVFDENHNLSKEEMDEVKNAGRFKASMKTYSMIMEKLGRQASRLELSIQVNTLTTWDKLNGTAAKEGSTGKNDQRREKKANSVKTSVANSGVSTLTVNSVNETKPKISPCDKCSLYHVSLPKCPIMKDGKLSMDACIKYKSVRAINAKGVSSLNGFWKKKFKQWVLPKCGMAEDEDQKKWFKKIEELISKIPTATEEEIKKYNADNVKFIHLCKRDEERGTLLTNNATTLTKKQRRAARSSTTVQDDDTDSSSSDESLEDASLDSSH